MGKVLTAEPFHSRLKRVFEVADPCVHASYAWRPAPNYGFASQFSFVPILLEEIFPVAGSLPIVFATTPERDLAMAVIAPSTKNQSCAVLADGRWIAGYVPSILRLHPFACSFTDEPIVMFDTESPLIVEAAHGTRFFDVTGLPTPAFERVSEAVKNFRHSLDRTTRVVSLLRQAGLLQPARAIKCFDDPAFEAVMAVDPHSLLRLQSVRVPPLFASGALGLAYAHVASIEQAPRLAQLSRVNSGSDVHGGSSANGARETTFFDMLANALDAETRNVEVAK